MSIDERLYQFATHHLGKDEKYRDEIPPFEEISHADLVLAAMIVFYRQNCSPEETVYGMEKLGVDREETKRAFLRIVEHFAERN